MPRCCCLLVHALEWGPDYARNTRSNQRGVMLLSSSVELKPTADCRSEPPRCTNNQLTTSTSTKVSARSMNRPEGSAPTTPATSSCSRAASRGSRAARCSSAASGGQVATVSGECMRCTAVRMQTQASLQVIKA